MTIIFSCPNPNCRRLFKVEKRLAGKKAKCVDCQTVVTIPAEGVNTLDDELSQIEGVVSGCEKEIEDGRISTNTVLRQMQTTSQNLASNADMDMAKQQVDVLKNKILDRMEPTITRLMELKLHMPDHFQVDALGRRAVNCSKALGYIWLDVNNTLFTPDMRGQMQAQNQEQRKALEAVVSTRLAVFTQTQKNTVAMKSPPVPPLVQPPTTPIDPIPASEAMSTEILLLIILGIAFAGLCVMELVGLPWVVFIPATIITGITMVFVWNRKKENELIDRAEQGDVQAQYELAQKYHQRKKSSEAHQWFMRAAENGYALAQLTLGQRYKDGDGIENNPKQACFWFEKAANQGLADAQYETGKCYQKGKGVQESLAQAMTWFEKAAKQGHSKTLDELEFLARQRREEEQRRREQEKKDQYKADILSGRISYDDELNKIEEALNSYMQESLRLYQCAGGSQFRDNLAHIWAHNRELMQVMINRETRTIDNCQVKLRELLDIKWDTRTEDLIDRCKEHWREWGRIVFPMDTLCRLMKNRYPND